MFLCKNFSTLRLIRFYVYEDVVHPVAPTRTSHLLSGPRPMGTSGQSRGSKEIRSSPPRRLYVGRWDTKG